ncbi:hypothetical protein ACFU5O_35020 [Streptomyces sp. NPDC057445]|uniref:hypothetical protein n=1 Tax=Streptomyces sp. NPDC057445 TaxID=3346136 RepID=UPI0036AFF81E
MDDGLLREIGQVLHGVLAGPAVAEQRAKGRLVTVPKAAVDFTPQKGALRDARRDADQAGETIQRLKQQGE